MSDYEFRLPDIGEGLSEGEIVRWHAAPGDRVEADQILVDVETDKAVVEIPAPVNGVLKTQGGQPGEVLPVGGLLAVIETDEAPATAPRESATAPPVEAEAPSETAAPAPRPGGEAPARPGRVRASPATRKLAVELGVDLAAIEGSGDRGLVTREDVLKASQGAPAEAAPAAPAPVPIPPPLAEDKVVPLRGLRRRIAQTMTESWRNIPHTMTIREIEVDELVRAYQSLKSEFERSGVRFTYLSLFVKAVASALKRHPNFNASIDMEREEIVYRHRYNIGLATATPDGLIVTVVHDADRLPLLEVARTVEALTAAARERKVGHEQLTGGTFTITNFGSYGGWLGTPIIRPPEVAIAGFGAIRDAVVAVDGVPAVRKLLPLVVAADHRVNDGQHLGAFVTDLSRYLSDPVRLLGQV